MPLFTCRIFWCDVLLNNTTGVFQLFGPPYYKFFDQDSPSTVVQGMDYIASSINTNKPDIIFGHSEGAAAILSTLLHRSCTVKCLILVSPFPPFDESGTRRLDISLTGAPLVNMPVLLVRGNQDLMAHFVTFAQELVNKKNLTVYSWDGGHSVPNSSERGLWAQIAQEAVQIVNRCD